MPALFRQSWPLLLVLLAGCGGSPTTPTLTHRLFKSKVTPSTYVQTDEIEIHFDPKGYTRDGCRSLFVTTQLRNFVIQLGPRRILNCFPVEQDGDPGQCSYDFSLRCVPIGTGRVDASISYDFGSDVFGKASTSFEII